MGTQVAVAVDEVAKPSQGTLDHSNGTVHVARHRRGDAYPNELPHPRLHAAHPAALVPPSQALRALFAAASLAGAYAPSPDGALARLQAWTLAALLGLPPGTQVGQVAEHASRARWVHPSTDDEFFLDAAYDLWMVVDDGRSITSFAATDTP